jgi:hypothetical protein
MSEREIQEAGKPRESHSANMGAGLSNGTTGAEASLEAASYKVDLLGVLIQVGRQSPLGVLFLVSQALGQGK